MLAHCRDARYVWNLAVEQQHRQLGRRVGRVWVPKVGWARFRLSLNRAISRSGRGRCSACGHVAPENRKSQAVFECQACTAGQCNADVNAARNIAAGRAVTARGDLAGGRSANRDPQLSTPAA